MMELTGQERIAAPRAHVWQALNDPEILKACIPGCESIEMLSPTEMKALVALKLGPIKARFAGQVTLSDIDPPNGYTISGEGSGGSVGGARGSAQVKLTEDSGATLLDYNVSSQVSGKIAQLGSRLVDSTAQKLAGDFFGKFREVVSVPAPAEPALTPSPEAAPTAAAAATPARASPWPWFLAGAVAIGAILIWLALRPGG
jgi:carbon monoxide dehydrogenase subunit G